MCRADGTRRISSCGPPPRVRALARFQSAAAARCRHRTPIPPAARPVPAANGYQVTRHVVYHTKPRTVVTPPGVFSLGGLFFFFIANNNNYYYYTKRVLFTTTAANGIRPISPLLFFSFFFFPVMTSFRFWQLEYTQGDFFFSPPPTDRVRYRERKWTQYGLTTEAAFRGEAIWGGIVPLRLLRRFDFVLQSIHNDLLFFFFL